MANQRWRDRLLKELHRQGLPSGYVSRLVEELTDHANDLFMEDPSMDAEQNADARLGTPEQLAAVARDEFRRRTFAGRHPVLTFLLGPLIAVPGTFIGTFLTVEIVWIVFALLIDWATVGNLSEVMNEQHTTFGRFVLVLSYSASFIMRFVPFALATWVFVRLGRRSGLRWWSMVACGVIAVTSLFFWSKVAPVTAEGKAQWVVGFTSEIGFGQIVQAAVPLAFGAWLLWRSPVSRPKMLAA